MTTCSSFTNSIVQIHGWSLLYKFYNIVAKLRTLLLDIDHSLESSYVIGYSRCVTGVVTFCSLIKAFGWRLQALISAILPLCGVLDFFGVSDLGLRDFFFGPSSGQPPFKSDCTFKMISRIHLLIAVLKCCLDTVCCLCPCLRTDSAQTITHQAYVHIRRETQIQF